MGRSRVISAAPGDDDRRDHRRNPVYSMTGYASRSFEYEGYTIFIELKSLNNRYLEVRFKLPPSLEGMEEKFRRILRGTVSRGKVDVGIRLAANQQVEFDILREQMRKYYGIVRRIAEEEGYDFGVSLSELLSLRSLMSGENTGKTPIPDEEMERIFGETLSDFQESRSIEGVETARHIEGFIREIDDRLGEIDTMIPEVVARYRDTLRKRIQELIDDRVDEMRLVMEVGIFANKVDIAEEVSRIRAHIERMRKILATGGVCGRELDFVSQEVHREINTVGAKVPDYFVSEKAVEIKTSLEKIKEQVRNLE
jgi:uncharacterized protein (TIGR00255 family)